MLIKDRYIHDLETKPKLLKCPLDNYLNRHSNSISLQINIEKYKLKQTTNFILPFYLS